MCCCSLKNVVRNLTDNLARVWLARLSGNSKKAWFLSGERSGDCVFEVGSVGEGSRDKIGSLEER